MSFILGSGVVAGDLSRDLAFARILTLAACAEPVSVAWSNLAYAGDVAYPQAIASPYLYERGKVVDAGSPASVVLTYQTEHEGSAVLVNMVAIAGHDFGSTGAEFELTATSASGGAVTLLDRRGVTTDMPILISIPEIALTELAVTIYPAEGAVTGPKLAFCGAGMAVEMEAPSVWKNGAPAPAVGYRTTSTIQTAQGEPIGMIRNTRGGTRSFQWSWMAESFARQELPALRDDLSEGWFVIAERPARDPGDTFLGWVNGAVAEPSPTGSADLHSWELSAEIYIDG